MVSESFLIFVSCLLVKSKNWVSYFFENVHNLSAAMLQRCLKFFWGASVTFNIFLKVMILCFWPNFHIILDIYYLTLFDQGLKIINHFIIVDTEYAIFLHKNNEMPPFWFYGWQTAKKVFDSCQEQYFSLKKGRSTKWCHKLIFRPFGPQLREEIHFPCEN